MNSTDSKIQKIILALILIMFVAVAAIIAYKIRDNQSDFESDQMQRQEQGLDNEESIDEQSNKEEELPEMEETEDPNSDLEKVIQDLENTDWAEDLDPNQIDELTQ